MEQIVTGKEVPGTGYVCQLSSAFLHQPAATLFSTRSACAGDVEPQPKPQAGGTSAGIPLYSSIQRCQSVRPS